jgi:hypothetical protein
MLRNLLGRFTPRSATTRKRTRRGRFMTPASANKYGRFHSVKTGKYVAITRKNRKNKHRK